MKLGRLQGRAVIETGRGMCVDVERASGGRLASDVTALWPRWAELRTWAAEVAADPAAFGATPYEAGELGCPVTTPRQVFAIGLNYADHASEAGLTPPAEPAVFTKFASSFGSPVSQVALPAGQVDWEAELVVVMAGGGRAIPRSEAWSHVAGLAVGQDLSERVLQKIGPMPQFSLAKSFAGFSPIGPFIVTPDELDDPDDLEIGCALNGEAVQKSRTSQLVFPVPELIARLSRAVEILPGDVIFTGTPAGVGASSTPPRFLQAGDELVTRIDGLGELRQTFITAPQQER